MEHARDCSRSSAALALRRSAAAAAIFIGTRIATSMTSRADKLRTRLASPAVAVLLAQVRRQGAAPALAAE